MPFIIPNATDTTSGNKYESLNQAEPDALDFELLGNRKSGVLNGCEVTAQVVANNTVSVTSGTVSLNGVVYTLAAVASHPLPVAPTNNRFDLVVARLASGVMSITTCYGSDSVDNPVFPRSGSRVISTAGLPSNSFVNPDTDVVLAAVYRSGGSVITNARIVDKRVTVNSGIILQGNATPASGLGTDGDLYLKTLVEDDDSSGVFVKRSGEWGELAAAGIDPGVPIGAVITWVSSIVDPNPDIWVECDGSALPRTGEYTELFATLGTTYGAGDGATTFNLPDFRGQFLMGMPAAGRVLGTRYGNANNQITLSTSNLPSHSHGVGGISTSQTGDHAHLPKSSTGGGSDPFNWGFIERSSLLADASVSINRNPPAATFGISRSTANAGQHAHTIAAGSVTGLTGSGSAVSIEPSNFSVRFFIRYA